MEVALNTDRSGLVRAARRIIPATGALILAACPEARTPFEGKTPTGQSADFDVSGGSGYAEERPHHNLARRVPSLGGFFFDTATGNLVVNLTDLSQAGAVKGLLRSMLARELAETRRRHPQADVVVRQGTYTFLQLKAWRDRLVPGILDVSGVVWVDLDEANNRIVIGLDQETAATDPAPVREVARSLGVPEEAVDFESSGPFVPQRTINDAIRPIVGGLQIDARPEATAGPCTLGFTAVWRGKKTFVTASHCSKVWLAPDSTAQYQPTKTPGGAAIGYEVADTSWPCGRDRCSYADASVYSVPDGADSTEWVLGRLARARLGCLGDCYPPDPAYKEISPNHPYFYIDGTQSAWVTGDLVDMIGEESGLLQGFVVRTCIVFSPGGTRFRFECQHQADYVSHEGDSGAPVFYDWNLLPDSTIWLGGIHVGIMQNKSVFSPWSGIVQNYPDLKVGAPSFDFTVEPIALHPRIRGLTVNGVPQPEREPDSSNISAAVRVGDQPAQGAAVQVRAEFLDTTGGHAHIQQILPFESVSPLTQGPDAGFPVLGHFEYAGQGYVVLQLTPDANGSMAAQFVAGYAGGRVRLTASATLDSQEVARKNVELEIRVPDLVNLEDSLTNVYWIGGTAAHPQGVNWHVVPGVVAGLQSIADSMLGNNGGQTLYLQYNDASLPLGGTFTVTPSPLEDPWDNGGHISHAIGVDIDIGLCYAEYSGNDNQVHRVFPGPNLDCGGRPELVVSRTRLEAFADRYNAVSRSEGDHYHIRFK